MELRAQMFTGSFYLDPLNALVIYRNDAKFGNELDNVFDGVILK